MSRDERREGEGERMNARAGSVSQFTHASPHTGACVSPIIFASALEQILAQQSGPSPSGAGPSRPPPPTLQGS